MRVVDIGELESNLETYIGYARAGERIVILENAIAVAMLKPMNEPADEPALAADSGRRDGTPG